LKPIEFFQLFLSDEILQEICLITNESYQSKDKKNGRRRDSHKKKWEDLDKSTLRCFFGMLLFMGHVQKPHYKIYWSKSVLFGTFGFSKLLSFDHPEQIKTNLRFTREALNQTDPLTKIRNFINQIIMISRKLYTPQQNLTIDESMIKFKGRHKLRVYIPLKPVRFGFKAYILAEAGSGFVLSWQLHEGKKKNL